MSTLPYIGDNEKIAAAKGFAVIDAHERASVDGAKMDLAIRYSESRHAGRSHHEALVVLGDLLHVWYPGSTRPEGWPTETAAPVPPVPPVRLVRPLVGPVRVIGRSFGDATGPRIVHGYSDFAAVVKFHEDPDKFKREAERAAVHQQYVRVLWRLNGWLWSGGPTRGGGHWPNAGLTVDPIRDEWFDDAVRGMLAVYRDVGLRVNLSSGDMNGWSQSQAEASFRRVAQIAASVSPDLVWLSAATNELAGTMDGGESDANIAFCEACMREWARHYPRSLRAISDAAGGAKADLTRLSRGNATVALMHDVRWETPDALRRAFNTAYENRPDDRPLVQDEPTGPNGSPPHNAFTRHVYQPIEDHDDLLAIYTMHVLTGQASTYFNDPALVSREPIDSTWGFREIPAAWRAMAIPEDIGQGRLYHGGRAEAMFNVRGSGASRADGVTQGRYNLGVISGVEDGARVWRVKSRRDGDATAFTAGGGNEPLRVVWRGRVSVGQVLPITGPTPTIVRIVT